MLPFEGPGRASGHLSPMASARQVSSSPPLPSPISLSSGLWATASLPVLVASSSVAAVVASDLFGLDWTGFEDRSSPVLWKPDLDPGAPVYPLNLIW